MSIKPQKRFSLFRQIFLTLLLILSLTSITFVITAVLQSKKTVLYYNKLRFFRKEERVRTAIDYAISLYQYNIDEYNFAKVLTPKMYELKEAEETKTRLYDLDGNLIFDINGISEQKNRKKITINESILIQLAKKPLGQSLIIKYNPIARSSFCYIRNGKNETVGIVEISDIIDNHFLKTERNNIIKHIVFIFFIVFTLSSVLLYFFSKNISDRITSIAERIKATDINSTLETIDYKRKDELWDIVNSYNNMVMRLKESTQTLAKIEREEAWKRMARQVAHEIKNPLTPMKLSIQSFQRRFDVKDPKATDKMNNLCNSLLQQIDTLSNITNAFMDFAKMPTRKDEEFNVIPVIKNSLEIFDDQYIQFSYNKNYIPLKMDKSQLDRVMNNLVKNAFQATPSDRAPEIEVQVTEQPGEVIITIKDNGSGIPPNLQEKIFEPKFTTKNSGMGLGLAMVKKILTDYNATISVSSVPNEGATFTIKKKI